MAQTLLDVLAPSRDEAGWLGIHAFRSTRDPRLFYIHSEWAEEAAFEGTPGCPTPCALSSAWRP